MTYEEWIEQYKETRSLKVLNDGGCRSLRGLCAGATEQMVAAFPELRRVRGHVGHTAGRAYEPHWWCVDPNGNIVDPTREQFFEPRVGWTEIHYEEFDESLAHMLPTGKCMNCGGHLYYHARFCNETCARLVHADMDLPWPPGYEIKYNPTDEEITSGAKPIYEVF